MLIQLLIHINRAELTICFLNIYIIYIRSGKRVCDVCCGRETAVEMSNTKVITLVILIRENHPKTLDTFHICKSINKYRITLNKRHKLEISQNHSFIYTL